MIFSRVYHILVPNELERPDRACSVIGHLESVANQTDNGNLLFGVEVAKAGTSTVISCH